VLRAAGSRVEALLLGLSRARAAREAAGAARVGANAKKRLELDGREQAQVSDGAGGCGPAEREVQRADGATLCFPRGALTDLDAGEGRLRERRLFPLRLDEVRAVDVVEGARRLSLRRESGAWRIIAPADAVGPARDEAVRAWLTPLLEAEARAFAAAAPHAAMRVRVATSDEEIAAEVDSSLARRLGETASLELSTPLRIDIDPAPLRTRAADGGS
jgi:hypothetical protein